MVRYCSLRQAKQFVDLDDHRPALRAFIRGNAAFDQFFHDLLAGFFFLAVEVILVEADIQRGIHLVETFQRPLARLLPERHDLRVTFVPAGVNSPHFGFQVGILFQAPGWHLRRPCPSTG